MIGYERIALVNVRLESRQRIPVGLLTLAACVKDSCRPVIFDPEPDDLTLAEITDFQPDLIGLGFMTQTRNRAKEISDILRRKLPHAGIILGGVGPTVETQAVFEKFKPDAIVVGEGEKALKRIVSGEPFEHIPGVYLAGHAFRPPEIYENLDDIPLPAYDCMPDFERYLCPPGGIRGQWFNHGTPMIITGRGCPYRCTFCSSHLMFGRRVRRRSVGSVIEEVRRLHYDYDVDAVYFFDDTFNAPPSWVHDFCGALGKEPYRITWGCQIRVNLFSADIAKLMKEAGCVQVDIGVESGSPNVLKALHKDETLEQIEAAFQACHEAGIAPMGTFLVGCPEETWEDVEQTKSLLRRIRPSFSEFFFLIPYPGAELYRQAEENHWIVDYSYEGRGMVDRPVMEITFTLDEQRAIRRSYFRMMALANIKGYLSLRVFKSLLLSFRPFMVKAAFREFVKTGNIRDAMQAYVHALRRFYAESARRKKGRAM